MLEGQYKLVRAAILISPLLLMTACASQHDLDAVKATADQALATANAAKAEADKALQTAQSAQQSATQAESDAKAADEKANRMFQRGLRK
ncbi:MAG TPA: Lpp/OprI family alanine-zipper lipoprotein [Alphaproteobacteria bacterium]|nr:Lpp/OprI family alanine-zipper lipoprotein [Alphaproteobacteria bacterium]